MIQVTKKQFYAAINPHDICVTSRGYPYSRFETRQRLEIGRGIARDEKGETITEYFLTENFYEQNKKAIEESKQ